VDRPWDAGTRHGFDMDHGGSGYLPGIGCIQSLLGTHVSAASIVTLADVPIGSISTVKLQVFAVNSWVNAMTLQKHHPAGGTAKTYCQPS
jgi:hypothetical protein